MRRFGRRSLTVAVLVLAVTSVGAAVAGWVVKGEGFGYGKVAVARMMTTQDASGRTTGDLYPGGMGNLVLIWENPNPFSVRLTEFMQSGPFIIDDGTKPGCVEHGLRYRAPSGVAFDFAPGESREIVLEDVLSMAESADDGCQGAGFSMPVMAKGIIITGS